MENDKKKENEEILKKFKERFEEEKKESYDNIQWAGQYIKNSVVCFIYSLVCSALTGIIAGGLLSSGQEGTAGGVSEGCAGIQEDADHASPQCAGAGHESLRRLHSSHRI